MHIANPIYDVVFKFMMEDEKVAKSFLSAIIEEEVLELNFATRKLIRRPLENQESQEEEIEKLFLTVCRFDFSAKILTPDGGFKMVMIELQKAKFLSDIMRFRRYLDLHYQNLNDTYGSEENKKNCPIYSIFLVGYDLDHYDIGISDHPIIHVNHNYENGSAEQDFDFDTTNEFIQSLHHQSWIIQINQLKQNYQNNREKILSIFDQKNRITNRLYTWLNCYILNVNEDEFPERYSPIIHRLRMASESEEILIEMEMEDDFIKELQDKERFIAKQGKTIKEQDKTLKEQEKALKEKDKALEETKKHLKKQKST
jgi:hypothetical protein